MVISIKDLLMDIIGINKLNNIKITSRTNNVNKDTSIIKLTTRTGSEILFWK